MAKNSIRVKSATEYRIPIEKENIDTGEWEITGYISFDPMDVSTSSKAMKAFDRLNRITEEYEARASEIDARPDEPLNDFVSRNQFDGINLLAEACAEARAALDGFLGAGACQKIFGDVNRIEMFGELAEQLEPHFKAIGISAAKLRESAVAKYAPKSKTVLK